MRLTRNKTPDGKCKYAIVRLDKLREIQNRLTWRRATNALELLEAFGLLEYGQPSSEEECFVIKLKDVNAPAALDAYAQKAAATDQEFADDIHELFERALRHPSRKMPD